MRLIPYQSPESLSPSELLWAYNGLDCCVTREIWDIISPSLSPHAAGTYLLEKRFLGCALDMMRRGIRVDAVARSVAIGQQEILERKYEEYFSRLTHSICGREFNPRSGPQLKDLFYNYLHLPPVWTSKKGQRVMSMDRETLEKLHDHFLAEPLITLILATRDARKILGFLRSSIDGDGRMRTSYNVAGTETGRWSSYASSFDTGTNLQNLPVSIRDMFISDSGWKLCYLDLQQAESRGVGALAWRCSGRDGYLRACESGDLHTTSCKLIWPDRPWTGDAARDRELADEIFYRWFSYRDISKRGGHGSNYFGKAYTLAKRIKVPQALMEDFQRRYFKGFPELSAWHIWVAGQLQLYQRLITPFGRERQFFGRPRDDSTLREAIAFEPQSLVGDCLNTGMDQLYRSGLPIQLLAQVHDAILFQYPEGMEDELLPRISAIVEAPFIVEHNGERREVTIPSDMETGWNWRKYDKKSNPNPDSLMKWKGPKSDTRKRTYDPSERSLLDAVLY